MNHNSLLKSMPNYISINWTVYCSFEGGRLNAALRRTRALLLLRAIMLLFYDHSVIAIAWKKKMPIKSAINEDATMTSTKTNQRAFSSPLQLIWEEKKYNLFLFKDLPVSTQRTRVAITYLHKYFLFLFFSLINWAPNLQSCVKGWNPST